jgi:hypothetical protein
MMAADCELKKGEVGYYDGDGEFHLDEKRFVTFKSGGQLWHKQFKIGHDGEFKWVKHGEQKVSNV